MFYRFHLHELVNVYAVGAPFFQHLGFLLRTRKLCRTGRREEFHPQQSMGCPWQLCSASWCCCPAAGLAASTGEQSGHVLFKLALLHG